MRSPNGRFCKALPDALTKGPVTQTPPFGVEGMAEGEGGTTTRQRITDFGFWHLHEPCRYYYHINLMYPVKVKEYDHFNRYEYILR